MSGEDNATTNRRGFLKFFGLGTAAAGATALTMGGEAVEAAEEPRAEGRAGYRETAHVRTFYESARF